MVDKAEVLARQKSHTRREPVTPDTRFSPAPVDFDELEPPLTEAEARAGAGGCLDCGVCSECQECVSACPADAIRFDKLKNAMQSNKGRAKDLAGQATHDRSLEAEGKKDQAVGDLKQAGEKVKDAFDK